MLLPKPSLLKPAGVLRLYRYVTECLSSMLGQCYPWLWHFLLTVESFWLKDQVSVNSEPGSLWEALVLELPLPPDQMFPVLRMVLSCVGIQALGHGVRRRPQSMIPSSGNSMLQEIQSHVLRK